MNRTTMNTFMDDNDNDGELHDLQLHSGDAESEEMEREGVMRNDAPTTFTWRAWLPGVVLILVGVIVIVTVLVNGPNSNNSDASDASAQGWPRHPELSSPGRFDPTRRRNDFDTVGANFGLFVRAIRMSEQGGYGMRVAISGDGHRIAASWPPASVRISTYNPDANLWEEETTIEPPDVGGDQEHDGKPHHDMQLAKSGQRIVLSHFDQVSAYFHTEFTNEWKRIGQQVNPSKESVSGVALTRSRFGSQLAITDDGALLAVLDEAPNRQRVKIFWDNQTATIGTTNTVQDEWTNTYEINVCPNCGTGPIQQNTMDPGDVAMSGDGNMIAIANLGSDQNAGEVKLYEYRVQTQSDRILHTFSGRPGNNQEYGTVVKLSSDGSTIAIAPRVGGFVDVYRKLGNGAWDPLGQRLGNELGLQFAKDTNFGASVAMSQDGSVVAIGGTGVLNPTDTTPERFRHGYVVVYQYDPASIRWRPLGAATTGESGDGFGSHIDMSFDGSRLIVGAPFRMWETGSVGSVHVYQIPVVTLS